MATTSFDNIKILRDDEAQTLKAAFTNRLFYGADSSVPDGDPDGYPDETLSSTSLGFDIADYEVLMPVELTGTTIAVNTGDGTVTATGGTPFTAGSAPVGKLLWDATDPSDLRLIGKIGIRTNDNVVELVENYLGASNLSGVTAYISNVAATDHNQSLDHKGNFYILVKRTDTTYDGDSRFVLPSVSGMQQFVTDLVGGVQQGLNTTYVALNRLSSVGIKNKPLGASGEVEVPATIKRINLYQRVGTDYNSPYFETENDIPFWVAYEVNPFGLTSKNLDKNTVYSLEIQEVLPTWDDGLGDVRGITIYVPYISATYGVI
jgi:hypothetical protein